jgi:threonine dehydratase
MKSKPPKMPVQLKNIYEARQRLKGIVNETPLIKDKLLSKDYSCNVFLKQENLQEIRSYKIRGAFNMISKLNSTGMLSGVVCASAGNHAQGVAYSANLLGLNADIFMPLTTPIQKLEQVKLFGGDYINIHLIGDDFEEALSKAKRFSKQRSVPFIPPYDNPDIIAGQGTIGLEILEQLSSAPDYVVVPVGGGGLAAGIALAINELSPATKLITVEPEGAPSLKAAIEAGNPIELKNVNTFVDGAAVKCVGDTNFSILKDQIDMHLTVPEGKVCTTLLETYNKAGMVLEPAGALSIAALPQIQKEIGGKTVICVISGGNNDITRMEEIKERSLLHEGLKHYFLVKFPQRPGALKEFVNDILEPGQDITHFEYIKRNGKEKGTVALGIEFPKPASPIQLQQKMDTYNFKGIYLNDNPELFNFLI